MEIKDINTKLKTEIDTWFVNQCHNPYEDYYFFYRRATPEHKGDFLIAKNQPENYEFVLNNRMNKGYSVEKTFCVLRPNVNRLPIID